MKPEAQRIAIAEECGLHPGDRTGYGLPDYLKDLNATEKMEEHLHGEEWENYFDAIKTWGRASGVRATAAQRCEQFLRAKGKWVEDK